MQAPAQPKVYPNLIQFLTIGIPSHIKFKEDKLQAGFRDYLPQNDKLKLEDYLKKEYNRIFEFSEDNKNYDFKENVRDYESV